MRIKIWLVSAVCLFVVALGIIVGCQTTGGSASVPPGDASVPPASVSGSMGDKSMSSGGGAFGGGSGSPGGRSSAATPESFDRAAASSVASADPVRRDEELWVIAKAAPTNSESSKLQADSLRSYRGQAAERSNDNAIGKTSVQASSSRAAAAAQPGNPGRPGSPMESKAALAATDAIEAKDATEMMDEAPPSGALLVVKDSKIIPCPLKHTDVRARVDGFVASVDVTQQYHNPFAEKIEATYVFPLPQDAAVDEFVMTIGDRTIRGIIREREEAKRIYEQAKQQGYTASLMQQERPNMFTQKVANIEPGKQIDIRLRYVNALRYVDGGYEFVFPMVVGPRFNPPGTSDGVGAVGRTSSGTSGQSTEVAYLKPDERSGHDINVDVELNAGVGIESIKSINHQVNVSDKTDPAHAKVTLSENDRLPNKDFVLRFNVAGNVMKQAVVTQRDERGDGYFALMFYPPATNDNLERRPVDLCFVLDVSGSMSGRPMDQSKAAMEAAMKLMRPGDTVQVIRFAGSTDQISPTPLPVTPQNIARVRQFVAKTNAGGGTMMLDGITRALNSSTDPDRVRYVCLLTDGFIGNEDQIIRATAKMRGNTRVFGFGVGSSPNRYLLDGMSRAGAGTVAYLALDQKGDDVMRPFFEQISRPVMTDLQLDMSGLTGAVVTTDKIPDLYCGRAVVLTGKFKGDGGTLVVRGRIDGRVAEQTFDVRARDEGKSIASLWARQRITQICDAAFVTGDSANVEPQVKEIALQYGLMSSYTSFVAVDSSQRTAGDHGVSVAVPVPLPDGVRYDTTVREEK